MDSHTKGKLLDKRKQSQRAKMPPQLPIQHNGDNYEPMELDVADFDESDELPVLDEVSLDLDSFICHYHGLSKVYRLEFIADHCKSLRIEALSAAINYIKENTSNFKDYHRLFKKLQEAREEREGGHSGSLQPDIAWIDSKKKVAELRFGKLDNDLKDSRTNHLRENIRRGQDDLGYHYLDCGELDQAFNAFSKSRDFVANHKNVVDQCLNMIRVGILVKRWSIVHHHVIRAESQPTDQTANPSIPTQLHCAAGLVELNSRRYKKAAKCFLSTTFDHFSQPSSVPTSRVGRGASCAGPSNFASCNPTSSSSVGSSGCLLGFSSNYHDRDASNLSTQWDLLTPVNIAVYGSLCALATFSRQELANQLINSASFKQFAELDPQLRDAVSRFYESKYASCLSILQEAKNVLLLDMYLAPHVERLYRLIRNKALVQYFEPYSSASMVKMAEAFNTTVTELENEIITLIYDGLIKARIDSHNKILYSQNTDPRTLTFERAIKMGKQWQRQTQALISRTAILNAGLLVTNSTLPDRTNP